MKIRTMFKIILGLIVLIVILLMTSHARGDTSAARAHMDTIIQQTETGKRLTSSLQSRLEIAEQAQRKLAIENDQLTVRNAQLEKAWISPRMSRVLLVAAIAVTVLRGIGLMSTGMLGAVASGTATGITGVFSFGLSLINSLADNVWFRVVQPKKQAKFKSLVDRVKSSELKPAIKKSNIDPETM